MSVKTRNISLPPELDALIGDRVRSGLYGDASEVVRAGLRALAREEMGVSLRRFDEIMAALPDGPPLTPEIEQDVERRIRAARAAARRRARKGSRRSSLAMTATCSTSKNPLECPS